MILYFWRAKRVSGVCRGNVGARANEGNTCWINSPSMCELIPSSLARAMSFVPRATVRNGRALT